MHVSDDQKYRLSAVAGYTRVNTWKFKSFDSRETEIKKWFTWHIISIIAENKPHAHHKTPFAYNESLQPPTIVVLLIKILIFFDHPVVFTYSKVVNFFEAIEFVDWHVSEKL